MKEVVKLYESATLKKGEMLFYRQGNPIQTMYHLNLTPEVLKEAFVVGMQNDIEIIFISREDFAIAQEFKWVSDVQSLDNKDSYFMLGLDNEVK